MNATCTVTVHTDRDDTPDYTTRATVVGAYDSLRSMGRLYRLSDDMGVRFGQVIREARRQGQTWASIARDARVTVRTAQRYAARAASA